jgi:hypothetical protein
LNKYGFSAILTENVNDYAEELQINRFAAHSRPGRETGNLLCAEKSKKERLV